MITKLVRFLGGGWIGYAAIAALIAGAGAWGWYQIVSYGDSRAAEVKAQWVADISARELLAAAAAEEKRVKEKQHELDIEAERKQREVDRVVSGRALADTRAALERLRSTTATVAASAVQASQDHDGRPGTDDPASRLGEVFGECSGRLVEMAEQTEQLGVRLRGLQAYATSAVAVCGE